MENKMRKGVVGFAWETRKHGEMFSCIVFSRVVFGEQPSRARLASCC